MTKAARSLVGIGFLLLCGLPVGNAKEETYRIDPARSAIRFSVRHMLGTVNGSFKQFSGRIGLDRERPEQSSANATIQVRSIDSGIARRDEHMRGPDFFDIAKYPEITFQSRSVKQIGNRAGDIVGDFTMHGVTRTITLHVRFLGTGKSAAGAETTRWRVTTDRIKRDDYGLRWSNNVERISMIGRDVGVTMEIEAEPPK